MLSHKKAAASLPEGRPFAMPVLPCQQRVITTSAIPRTGRANQKQFASSRLQEQQDRWWQAGDGEEEAMRLKSRAARAGDWEEETGKGLTGYRFVSYGKDGDEGSEKRGRRMSSGARWSGGSGGSKGDQQRQQHRQQDGAEDSNPYISRVKRVWHSPEWKPARGRRAMNEETDVESDTDDLLEAEPVRARQAQRQEGGRNSNTTAYSSSHRGGSSSSGSRRQQLGVGQRGTNRGVQFWEEGVAGEEGEEDEEGAVKDSPGRGDGQAGGDLSRSALRGEALYGVHPILNALLQGRRKPYKLYVLTGMDLSKRKDARAVHQVLSLAPRLGVDICRVSRHELNTLSSDKVHQGLVLDCSPMSFTPMDKLPPAAEIMQAAAGAGAPAPVWVALDEVLDPQNFGAMLRSCWCLGAAGMLVSSKNCAPLSPAVSKASAGAMEAAEVHAARMLRDTLVDAAASGWLVLGAAGDAGAQSCQDVRVDKPTIIVLGNEGRGLRTNIRRACTGFVRVDMGTQGQGFTGLGAASQAQTSSSTGSSSTAFNSGGSSAAQVTGSDRNGTGYWGGEPETGHAATMTAANEFGDDDGDGVTPGPKPGGPADGARSPMRGGGPKGIAGVDSLNVSVATGILLHSLTASAARHARSASQTGASS